MPSAMPTRRLSLLIWFFALCSAWAADSARADWQQYCPEGGDAQQVPGMVPTLHSQGRLWRVSGPDGTEPNWVFGTMHLDFPQVTTLPPAAEAAFATARSLRVEVMLDARAQAEYARRMVLPGDTRLSEFLPAALYARYIDLARRHGLGITHAARLRPWAAANLIGRPPARSGVVLDEVLQRRAKARGLEVEGLEGMDELVEALDAFDQADQVGMLVDTLCGHAEIMESVPEQVRHYLDGDLAALAELNAQGEADAERAARFLERMLHQRNATMRDRLLEPLREGGTFVAVGALHLPGERGLLHLLEQAGFEVEPAG